MDERDYWGLLVLCGLLAVAGVLQARLARLQTEEIIALRADVEFLKDHTVARETEARP